MKAVGICNGASNTLHSPYQCHLISPPLYSLEVNRHQHILTQFTYDRSTTAVGERQEKKRQSNQQKPHSNNPYPSPSITSDPGCDPSHHPAILFYTA